MDAGCNVLADRIVYTLLSFQINLFNIVIYFDNYIYDLIISPAVFSTTVTWWGERLTLSDFWSGLKSQKT